jgi:hypothetical protein
MARRKMTFSRAKKDPLTERVSVKRFGTTVFSACCCFRASCCSLRRRRNGWKSCHGLARS